MPTLLTDDKAAADAFLAARRLGAGTAAGPSASSFARASGSPATNCSTKRPT